jgi:glucose-1-phosphate adenylyltransferase
MDLVGPHPRFRLEHPDWPLHTAPTNGRPNAFFAPGNFDNGKEWRGAHALITKGCTIREGIVDRSILSPGVCIDAEAEVLESVLLDGVRIGRGAKIRRAILDRGTMVPPGARIGYGSAADGEQFHLSEGGITVVGHTPPGGGLGKENGATVSHHSTEPSARGNGHGERGRDAYASGDMAAQVA